MTIDIELKYHDVAMRIRVEVSPARNVPLVHMDVFVKEKYIAACQCASLEHAQALARLLVGIEIQDDGAAWMRGPRPPAQPTGDGDATD